MVNTCLIIVKTSLFHKYEYLYIAIRSAQFSKPSPSSKTSRSTWQYLQVCFQQTFCLWCLCDCEWYVNLLPIPPTTHQPPIARPCSPPVPASNIWAHPTRSAKSSASPAMHHTPDWAALQFAFSGLVLSSRKATCGAWPSVCFRPVLLLTTSLPFHYGVNPLILSQRSPHTPVENRPFPSRTASHVLDTECNYHGCTNQQWVAPPDHPLLPIFLTPYPSFPLRINKKTLKFALLFF